MRTLLIAALFHDFNHTTIRHPDAVNIKRAIAGLKKYLAPQDKQAFKEIAALMKATEYPYPASSKSLALPVRILRDADAAQTFDDAWIQQVVFGLAKEWEKTPLEILEIQLGFLRNLKFNTVWAQKLFPDDTIKEKIAETQELIDLLKKKPER